MKTGEYLKQVLLKETNHTHISTKVTGFAFSIHLFWTVVEDSKLL